MCFSPICVVNFLSLNFLHEDLLLCFVVPFQCFVGFSLMHSRVLEPQLDSGEISGMGRAVFLLSLKPFQE